MSGNGKEAYYVAVAALLPVLLLAYAFTLKVAPALKRLNDSSKALLKVKYHPPHIEAGLTTIGVVAPLVALVAGVGGETAAMWALYTGSPTQSQAQWTVFACVALPCAFALHALVIGGAAGAEWLASRGQAQETSPQDEAPVRAKP